MTPKRLRKGGGELRILLGQRIAHMRPERRRRVRDLRGELLVGTGDVLPKVEAGNIGAPALPASVGHVTEDARKLRQGVSVRVVFSRMPSGGSSGRLLKNGISGRNA
jgi:hypothetical protein